jgi:hypothetical protein
VVVRDQSSFYLAEQTTCRVLLNALSVEARLKRGTAEKEARHVGF